MPHCPTQPPPPLATAWRCSSPGPPSASPPAWAHPACWAWAAWPPARCCSSGAAARGEPEGNGDLARKAQRAREHWLPAAAGRAPWVALSAISCQPCAQHRQPPSTALWGPHAAAPCAPLRAVSPCQVCCPSRPDAGLHLAVDDRLVSRAQFALPAGAWAAGYPSSWLLPAGGARAARAAAAAAADGALRFAPGCKLHAAALAQQHCARAHAGNLAAPPLATQACRPPDCMPLALPLPTPTPPALQDVVHGLQLPALPGPSRLPAPAVPAELRLAHGGGPGLPGGAGRGLGGGWDDERGLGGKRRAGRRLGWFRGGWEGWAARPRRL